MDNLKYFKEIGLTEEDFKIDTYRINLFDAEYKWGVEVAIPQIGISVKCHSEKSQIKNKDKCLDMLKMIINKMMEDNAK